MRGKDIFKAVFLCALILLSTASAQPVSQQAKLTASDAEASDYFGRSVSIDGDYAVVGAYAEDAGGSSAGAGADEKIVLHRALISRC